MQCLNTAIGLIDNKCNCASTATWVGATTYTSHVIIDYDGVLYQLDPSVSLPYSSRTSPDGDSNFINLQTSDSGFLVSDLIHDWNTFIQASSCFTEGYGLQLVRSRTRAIQQFKTDLAARVKANASKTIRPRFNGRIGETKAKQRTNPTTTNAGIRIAPQNLKTTQLTVSQVGLLINKTQSVTVTVYKDGAVLYTQAVSCTANQFSSANVSWTLPMYDSGGPIEYFITYNTSGIQPWETKLHCGCGGGIPWAHFMDATGVAVANPTDVDPVYTTSGNTYGLSLKVDVKCLTDKLICDENNEIDYDSNPLALVVAEALQHNVAQRMAQYVIDTDQLNREVMISKESLYGRRNHYRKEYEDRLEFLAQELVRMPNECYTCEETIMAAVLS